MYNIMKTYSVKKYHKAMNENSVQEACHFIVLIKELSASHHTLLMILYFTLIIL